MANYVFCLMVKYPYPYELYYLDTGAVGATGEKGDAGLQGVTGEKGDAGLQGVTGEKGDTGAVGATGPTEPTRRQS